MSMTLDFVVLQRVRETQHAHGCCRRLAPVHKCGICSGGAGQGRLTGLVEHGKKSLAWLECTTLNSSLEFPQLCLLRLWPDSLVT